MADFGGLKAVQSAAKPHILAQSIARTAQALVEVRNGPDAVDRVFRLMQDGQAQAQDGSAAAPAYSFESDPDTGVYRISADRLGLAAGATLLLDLLAGTGVMPKAVVRAVAGSAAAPAYTFDGDPDTGLFSQGANAMGLSAGGAEVARVVAGALRVLGQAVSDRHDNGTSGSVDWNNGSVQAITLDANKTITLANPIAGAVYTLEFVQDATGGRTVTWPASVKGEDGGAAPQPDATANRTTLVSLYFNGTNYLALDSGSGDI